MQTTIMAVEYDGGVILGADSRTTTGEGYHYHCVNLSRIFMEDEYHERCHPVGYHQIVS